jgi:hypothetical protein
MGVENFPLTWPQGNLSFILCFNRSEKNPHQIMVTSVGVGLFLRSILT